MADYRLTQTGQQVQNDLNNAENDHTTLANHVGDSSIHVTPENKTAWNAKYDKPGSGIPKSDLSSGVQTSLGKADTAYQKPGSGIPSSDMTSAVQTSLGKADSAYQKPGSGIPKSDMASAVQTSLGKADSAYQKPNSGIPQSDMDSSVQAKLNAAGSADQAINQERSDREAAVTAEASARQSADQNLQTQINAKANTSDMTTALNGKVDKVTGKGLSTNDYTDADKAKLGALPTNSELNTALAGKASTGDVAAKYTKPSGGIPKSDLASGVQTSLGKADTAYQKPGTGIPKSDMASAVQTSLDKADNAAPQSTTYNKTEVDTKLALKADKSDTYTKAQVDSAIQQEVIDRTAAVNAETTARQQADQQLQAQISGTYQAATQAATAAQQAQQQAGNAATEAENAAASAQAAADKLTELEEDIQALPDGQAVSAEVAQLRYQMDNEVLMKGEYSADTAVGLADQLRGSVYADEQFAVRMTGGEANEVGGIGVVQVLKGAGAAIVQMFPEGANHDFSGDVSLDGTGGNAEAPLRYSDNAQTMEMGYLLAMEAFVSQTLSQAQLDAIAAKDTGKADRDKAVWLTPAGAITSAPTIESGQTEVTFSGWRIAMRVKASEVRDASASSYWFTSGTAGRQVFDCAVAEGIDQDYHDGTQWWYKLANGWNTGSALEYLNHMAAQGLPTHQVKAMSALLAVTKIGIKTVKSKNLLNPQTGRALLKAYVNDDENFLDNEYTMLGGLPSGSTMAFTSLLTGKTETLTMLDSTHFVIPSDGWLQITGTLPTSIIATWNGEKDNTAADEYATESHVWDVTQLFGTKDGGTEGHYYRFAKEGMRGAGTAQDVVELVGARGECKMKEVDLGTFTYEVWANYQEDKRGYITSGVQGLISNTRRGSLANALIKTYAQTNYGAIYYAYTGKRYGFVADGRMTIEVNVINNKTAAKAALAGYKLWYELATPITFTSLFLSASSTADELTAMPADAIPLSEIQFADNNWSIEEAIFDAPEADANGVIDTLHQCTGQMRIQYSLDAAEQIDTLQKEYQALEARVTALENA